MARLFNVTIGARDPVELGRFWARALEFVVIDEGPDLVRLGSGDVGPDLLLMRVDVPATNSAVHLDLASVR